MQVVTALDDLDLKEGVRTEGDTHYVQLDGWAFNIDLNDVHYKELADFIQKYGEVGRRTMRPHKLTTRDTSGMGAARILNNKVRAWARKEYGEDFAMPKRGTAAWDNLLDDYSKATDQPS